MDKFYKGSCSSRADKLGRTFYLGKTPLNLDFSLDLPSPVCYFSPSEQGVHQADLAEGDEFKKMKNSDGEVMEYIHILDIIYYRCTW